jgi:Protein of unknown function (DUF3108)
MIRLLHRALFAACLLATALASAAPPAVRATYGAFMNGMQIGTISEQFVSEAGKYRIVSETKPTGLATLIQRQPLRFTSAGMIGRDGLRPEHFEARRSAGEHPQAAAEFDWAQARLLLKRDGKSEVVALPAGTQDRLSVMYQFMLLPLDRVRQIEFAMTNGRKLDYYAYRVTEEVAIETALGRLKTVHLVKVRDAGDTVTEIWLSPQHRFFPVRLLIVERDGMRFEQIIQSLDIRD